MSSLASFGNGGLRFYGHCHTVAACMMSDRTDDRDTCQPLDILATVVGIGGALLELVADEQMHAFAKVKQPGQVMDRGLWRYSRHPNYLGEIMFWLSLYLFALAVGFGFWWSGVGVLAMIGMFAGASIPMLDDRSEARRPEFGEYRRRTSALIPMPPKRG